MSERTHLLERQLEAKKPLRRQDISTELKAAMMPLHRYVVAVELHGVTLTYDMFGKNAREVFERAAIKGEVVSLARKKRLRR